MAIMAIMAVVSVIIIVPVMTVAMVIPIVPVMMAVAVVLMHVDVTPAQGCGERQGQSQDHAPHRPASSAKHLIGFLHR